MVGKTLFKTYIVMVVLTLMAGMGVDEYTLRKEIRELKAVNEVAKLKATNTQVNDPGLVMAGNTYSDSTGNQILPNYFSTDDSSAILARLYTMEHRSSTFESSLKDITERLHAQELRAISPVVFEIQKNEHPHVVTVDEYNTNAPSIYNSTPPQYIENGKLLPTPMYVPETTK